MKIIIFILLFTLSFSSTAFAGGRSSAGGGKLQKFDTGRWAMATGIGFGSAMVGGAIGNFIKPVQGYNSFSSWSNTYSVSLAGGQVGRAIGTAGSYYGWNPKTTIIASSIGSGMAGGALNPGQFGTTNMGTNVVTSTSKAMMLGGLSGGIQGGIVAASTKNGKTPIWAGAVGGLAGSFATGYATSGFTRAWKGAIVNAPSYAMQIGIEDIASRNENNASIIRQASSGLYPIVGAVSSKTLGPILKDGEGPPPQIDFRKSYDIPNPSGNIQSGNIKVPELNFTH